MESILGPMIEDLGKMWGLELDINKGETFDYLR